MTSGMRCTAIAVLFVALTGCRFFGKVQPDPAPLPAPPKPEEAKAPPPKVEPPGPPPKIETKAPEVPPVVAVIPTPPAPKRKKPQTKRTGTVAGTAQAPPQVITQPPKEQPGPTTDANATPAAGVPKLGEIFSDDQKLQYLKICDESLARAKDALVQLHGLSLSASQKQSMSRVRVFISQAEQARQRDPQTAKQLAERADLLSRDLLRTVR